MVNAQQRSENEEKIVRVHGTFSSNDDVLINASFEAHDCNILGSFTVQGNMKTRNIWLNDSGDLEVHGYVEANGKIEAKNVFVLGNLSCYSIHSSESVFIGGNCSCYSITSLGDVIIDGVFFGEIENIKIPEKCHIYINGKCAK